jgi:hypothetical protein
LRLCVRAPRMVMVSFKYALYVYGRPEETTRTL